MMTVIFLCILVAFTVIAVYFARQNDFAPEMASILFKIVAATFIASYFLVNSFIVNRRPSIEYTVNVPTMFDQVSGKLFTPYSMTVKSRPEELEMFKGLTAYNQIRLYDKLHSIPVWEKFASVDSIDDVAKERLEYLEFVFLMWLEQEVNWLKSGEKLYFSHSGSGGNSGVFEPNAKNSSKVQLGSIENPNPFFQHYPVNLTLPPNASVSRKASAFSVRLNISTNRGAIKITFRNSYGSIFQELLDTILIKKMAAFAKQHIGSRLPQSLWADYPQIVVRHDLDWMTQFSNLANSERGWIEKIERYCYRDFSWDLLREYLSVDFQAALKLYRRKYGDLL